MRGVSRKRGQSIGVARMEAEDGTEYWDAYVVDPPSIGVIGATMDEAQRNLARMLSGFREAKGKHGRRIWRLAPDSPTNEADPPEEASDA